MNKLINRISPETSENRILHAGFSIILMSEEITQTLSGLSSDMIIFILSGSITIYSTKEEKKTIGEQYMIFLTYIIHSGFISGYQNRYGDNLKPPTNVYHRMTA